MKVSRNPRPVLGIDLGSATLAAGFAYAGESPQPLLMRIRQQSVSFYRAELFITADGEIHRPDYRGDVVKRVGNLTRYLGQPPQIISGAPYGIHALMELLVGPALDAAHTLDAPPNTFAAVIPYHWPQHVTESYISALSATGLRVVPVLASDALASYAEIIETDGIVTCLNLGAQAAILSLALPDKDYSRYPETYTADTRGGVNYLAQMIVHRITHRMAPDFRPDLHWLSASTIIGRKILFAAQKAPHANHLVTATLLDPVGKVTLPAGSVNDLVEDLISTRLRSLTDDEHVQELWAADEEAGIAKKILVAGGLSNHKAVARAVRTIIGPWQADPHPQTILAMGAARFVAEGRHQ